MFQRLQYGLTLDGVKLKARTGDMTERNTSCASCCARGRKRQIRRIVRGSWVFS